MSSFEDLVTEGNSVPTEGWDFSWFEGRAIEQRPSWGYQRLIGERLAGVESALDLQTGGGEVLAGVPVAPPRARRDRVLGAKPGARSPQSRRARSVGRLGGGLGRPAVAAVVHFLRKVIWIVPGFTVEAYGEQLRALHEQIEADRSFVATTERFLIEARKPAG